MLLVSIMLIVLTFASKADENVVGKPSQSSQKAVEPTIHFNKLYIFFYEPSDNFEIPETLKNHLGVCKGEISEFDQSRLRISIQSDNSSAMDVTMQMQERINDKISAYCESLNIDSGNMKIDTKGALMPIATNSSTDGRAKNNRIEVTLLEK